MTFVKPVLKRP